MEPVRFRAGKKRKAYRQRAEEDDDDTASRNPTAHAAAAAAATTTSDVSAKPSTEGGDHRPADHDEGDSDEASVAMALRLRNARRARAGGVAFRNSSTRPDDDANSERALVPHDPDGAAASAKEGVVSSSAVTNRFTHQTGLLADLNDKHMMEYIEFRLSNRAGGDSSQNKPSVPMSNTSQGAILTSTSTSTTAAASKPESGHAVMQGHLMEIDLGNDVRDRNISRTERATQNGGVGAEDGTQDRRAKKPRLGRDGKPWRPRNRRGSDAIKRDQLVEQVLRETRLDVYELPPEQTTTASGADQGGATDDRLAEQFRQQFLDDVAERQLRKKKPTNQPPRPGSEDVLKGPKLGGSRNVRAQMRDLLLKKEKEGKK
ncbi:hypothetical protein ACJ41O_002428 [Fusarium nematophilum]